MHMYTYKITVCMPIHDTCLDGKCHDFKFDLPHHPHSHFLLKPWASRCWLSARRPASVLFTMPKRISREDASSEWVDKSWERWEEQRGHPKARAQADMSEHSTSTTWTQMAARAKAMAREKLQARRDSASAASSSGAARPELDPEVMFEEEARAYWKELTNMAFTIPGQFEPQQYVSFVAGRPVVVMSDDKKKALELSQQHR